MFLPYTSLVAVFSYKQYYPYPNNFISIACTESSMDVSLPSALLGDYFVKSSCLVPHDNMVGHASLSFGTNYVSFWPEDAAGKKDLKIKRSHPGSFNGGLNEDVQSEGGRQPITVTIPHFDDEKLSRFVADLISNTPRYQLARYNCSHVVAECLKVACNQGPTFRPSARNYSKLGRVLGHGIWTPHEILLYARELAGRSVK